MKKKLSLLLAMMMAVSVVLSACGGGSAGSGSAAPTTPDASTAPEAPAGSSAGAPVAKTAAASGEQKLVFALHNEPDGLDPGITDNTFAIPFLYNLFEGLVTYDSTNQLVPGQAEKWVISDDGLVYTFTLRDDLKWSDGTAMNANDYLYSLKRVLDPKTAAKYVYMITDYIQGAQEYYDAMSKGDEAAAKAAEATLGITAPDEKTLVLTLKAPCSYYLGIVAMWTYSPVQQATVEANGDKWTQKPETFVSNGPFKITQLNLGESVVMAKNENYWDAANVKLEEVTYRYILDQSTALSAFESGEIDGLMKASTADLPRLKAESDCLGIWPAYGATFFDFNNSVKPLDDVRVRKAISMAIDRTAIIENVLQTGDIPAMGLLPSGYVVGGKDFTEGRSDFGLSATANVEEAKKLLADAGFPNGEGFPKLRLGYYTDTAMKKIAEAVQQMLKQNLNIELEITTQDWAVYYADVQKFNYDITLMGWGADFLHPMSFLTLFTSDSPQNYVQYSNAEYDKYVKEAQSEVDPAKQMASMQKAEEILMNDIPFMPVYYRSYPTMMQTYVQGWYLSPLNYFGLKEAYIEAK